MGRVKDWMMELEFNEMISNTDIRDIYQDNEPKSLDAAYERRAIDQGLVTDPVFPENKLYLEQKNDRKLHRDSKR